MRMNASYAVAPDLTTIQSHVRKIVGEPLRECGFSQRRFDHALAFYRDQLDYRSCTFLLVWDATAVLPALAYQTASDTVIGLTIPDEELGTLNVHVGESLDNFLLRIRSYQLATQVEVVLLVPLSPNCPPYLLAAFAQSHPQTAETIEHRMLIARAEMERRGALIVGVAADGASGNLKLLRSMRQRTTTTPFVLKHVPTLSSHDETVQLPGRVVDYMGMRRIVPDLGILDPVHLLSLLRNAPLRQTAKMRIGAYDISPQLVRDRLEAEFGGLGLEAQLSVRATDFSVTDRMNFASAHRLFSTPVLECLERQLGAEPVHKGMRAKSLTQLMYCR